MGREEERIAEIESHFRDVNEHIAETAERFDADRANFYCECDDSFCYERVEVPLDDYEEVRGESTHFIVRAGHENERFERILARQGRYAIVEKVHRAVAAIVARLDPRADTTG
jgi:hypothetical protein